MCKILSDPYQDDKIQVLGKDTKVAPTIVKVLNLDSGAEALLVVNKIIAAAFERAGGSLINRYFLLKGGDIRDGKQYRDIDVTEMAYYDDNNHEIVDEPSLEEQAEMMRRSDNASH